MPPIGLIRAFCLATALPLVAAAAEPPPRRDPAKLTMKERLSGKASDPQRVNDCKVPMDQRGDRRRSPDCAKR